MPPGKHASRRTEELSSRLDRLFSSLFDFLPKAEVVEIVLGVEEELRTSGRWWASLLEDRRRVQVPQGVHPLLSWVYASLVGLGFTKEEAKVRVRWLEEGLVERGRIPSRAIIPELIAAGWNPSYPEAPFERPVPGRPGTAGAETAVPGTAAPGTAAPGRMVPGAGTAAAAPAPAVDGAAGAEASKAPAGGVPEAAPGEADPAAGSPEGGHEGGGEADAHGPEEADPARADGGGPDPGPEADPEADARAIAEFERWVATLRGPG
jgi:hypothetical protein